MFYVLLFILCCISSLQGGYISGCDRNGILLAREDHLLQIRCRSDDLLDLGGKLTWTIRPWRNQPSLAILCSSDSLFKISNCSSPSEVNVNWDGFHRSSLRINNVERGMFNSSSVSCNDTVLRYNHTHEKSCKIDVVYDAEVRSCDLEVKKSSWTVNGSCDVTKVYSSAGRYNYVINEKYNTTINSRSITRSVVNTSSLTSFRDPSSGNVYYRGRIPFSVSLPTGVGEVTYSVKVTPGTETNSINHTVVIEPPGELEYTNCNKLTFLEGGKPPPTPCECKVTSLGSPSGRLQWMADDVVLESGEYDVNRLPFPYDKLTRAHDGTDMFCRVDWVVKKSSTAFRAEIIYGPTRADIFVHEPAKHNDDVNMTLICEPYDAKVGSSVLTTWGGLCQGQQGRTCILTPPMSEHCGKEVTCTATNQNFPVKQASATWNVQSADCKAEKMAMKASLAEGVGIGVGVTLVVVLVVVAVMLLVLWRRRLLPVFQCCVPTYDVPSKKRQKEEEEQRNYTDLSHYEIVEGPKGTSSSARDKSGKKTKSGKESEEVYVNTEAL